MLPSALSTAWKNVAPRKLIQAFVKDGETHRLSATLPREGAML